MNGLFLFCYYILVMYLFFRHLFYSRSSYVSFVPILEVLFLFMIGFSYVDIILMGFTNFWGLFYSRSSHVSFVPILRRFVPILEVLGTELQNWEQNFKIENRRPSLPPPSLAVKLFPNFQAASFATGTLIKKRKLGTKL